MTLRVIRALEGHEYQLLKDKQRWRDFDHQSVQTVYAVRGKPKGQVLNDKFRLDYFEIISSLPGDQAVQSRDEWNAVRIAAGKATELESLPAPPVAGQGAEPADSGALARR